MSMLVFANGAFFPFISNTPKGWWKLCRLTFGDLVVQLPPNSSAWLEKIIYFEPTTLIF